MKTHVLKALVWLLLIVAFSCSLGLPDHFLAGWTPLARMAFSAAAQIGAYTAIAVLALLMESKTGGPCGRPDKSSQL